MAEASRDAPADIPAGVPAHIPTDASAGSPAAPRVPVLAVRGLAAGYGDGPIVRDVDFDLAAGSVTTIIGGNGAGKSTLLRALYGLNRRYAGTIALDGRRVEALDPPSRLAAGIGLVPQGRCNFPRLSVAENLALGTTGVAGRAERRARTAEVVALFPVLAAKWRELAGNLSGGEQQVLETAMVLQSRPRLLLLDEPSLGLSPRMLAEVFATVAGMRAAGATVMMVEQNVRGALAVSDRVFVMELGTKTLDGPPAEIRGDPRIRRAYLGGEAAGGAVIGAPDASSADRREG